MNIALVHDWVVDLGGGEKCLQIFHELYPEAPLYTLVYKPASVQSLGFFGGAGAGFHASEAPAHTSKLPEISAALSLCCRTIGFIGI